MIKKLLIANRGEIAIRIMKTAKSRGIRTVAIYSEADADAPHRHFADEAYLVGAAPASASYLRQDAIIKIAHQSKCDAIHPGYGFLSENAAFAQAVIDGNIKFVGPKPHSIRLMGDKLAAKQLAAELNIPLLPGGKEPIAELAVAEQLAASISYPVLLKAAGGGGGKGMRIVNEEGHLAEAFKLASSEARQSFDDPRVFVEKYLEAPRHIEIQVMADQHGNVVHVFERDCSVQRRHQKVIEESPATSLPASLRLSMSEAAIKITQACQYEGAGTLEFLVDKTDNFYFLEMNTRLQVEHPVTELISGIDLVAWQIDIANGLPLARQQHEIRSNGHSIELRIYAEDPLDQFRPSLGTVEYYHEPIGEGIRVDSGIEQDYDIPIYYDPMLSKLIVWAPSRIEAIARMRSAIKNYHIIGVTTTLPFGLFACEHEAFVSGQYDTHFIEKYFSEEKFKAWNAERAKVAALVAATLRQKELTDGQDAIGGQDWWQSRKWTD